MFKKAVKHESKLRLAIAGPSGSGKTYTSLAIGTALGRVAVVDTESGSASKYADLFDFDVMEIDAPFHPNKYIEAIKGAVQAGYDVVILDSLSHAWFAEGGVLSIVDAAAARSRSGNSYTAWKEGTPVHNSLITAILTAKIHVIGTMRSKTEYVMTINDKGKQTPQKMGMAPVQRDGMEYEFDVMIDMDINNRGVVTKTRCSALTGAVIDKPGADVAQILKDWLSGEPVPEPEPSAPLPDDEIVIMETSAAEFFNSVTALVDRYENIHAAKNAAKKLGYGAIPKDVNGRLEMYRAIKSHAAERDAEEAAGQAPLFDGDEPISGAYVQE